MFGEINFLHRAIAEVVSCYHICESMAGVKRWREACQVASSKINVMVTFNDLIINALFARNYHIKMLVAFLESFRLRFDSSVPV